MLWLEGKTGVETDPVAYHSVNTCRILGAYHLTDLDPTNLCYSVEISGAPCILLQAVMYFLVRSRCQWQMTCAKTTDRRNVPHDVSELHRCQAVISGVRCTWYRVCHFEVVCEIPEDIKWLLERSSMEKMAFYGREVFQYCLRVMAFVAKLLKTFIRFDN